MCDIYIKNVYFFTLSVQKEEIENKEEEEILERNMRKDNTKE